MPGGDGTGPLGQGAMTGRAAGYCCGNDRPGFANGPFGRRFGIGRRGGFGRGRGYSRDFGIRQVPEYHAPERPSKEQERHELMAEVKEMENEKVSLESDIEAVKKRIDELK